MKKKEGARDMALVRRIGERAQLRKVRPGGWTAEKREVFLLHLAATANAAAAARAVGMAKSGADKLRKREPLFAQAWQEALEESQELLANHVVATHLGTAGQPEYDDEAIAAGEYPEPPTPGETDPQMALETLKQLQGKAGKRLGRAPRMATKGDTAAALMTQIDRVRARQRRRDKRAQAEEREQGA
jgi:hypothetical protein